MPPKPRVLIVDDDFYVREALTALLTRDPRTQVVGNVASPEEALKWLSGREAGDAADVILLDMEFKQSPISGMEAIPLLRRLSPKAAILVFSMVRDDDLILRAIRAGASGYLWKNEAADGIASAIVRVHEGRFVVTRSVAQLLFGKVNELIGKRPAEILPDKKAYEDLTKRVEQVIRLFCIDGLAAAEIAEALNISENTVRGHIKAAYEILGVENRQEAFVKLVAREDE
jgi:DNA-binding NarL/FixJ family response regulator